MEPKIVLGIPHIGALRGYFADSVFAMVMPRGSYAIRVENHPVDIARNKIVTEFLQDKTATHLLFLDSDQHFHPKTAVALFNRHKDVVGGTYFARSDTPVPHIYDFAKVDELGRALYRPKAREMADFLKSHPEHAALESSTVLDTEDGLVSADALATGCMMISRQVLEAIEPPWFKLWPDSVGGEDFYFCQKAKEAGFEIWGDFAVQSSHEAARIFITRADFIDFFDVGSPDEHDWDLPLMVEAGPKVGQPRKRLIFEGAQVDFAFPHGVEGYLTEDEGRLLFELASKTPENGVIVELGSYKGKSTICLASAGRRVYAVDHFEGQPEYEVGPTHQDHVAGDYEDAFKENTRAAGVASNIFILKSDSALAAKAIPDRQVDLVFIDADHSYEACLRDFDAWEGLIAPEGLVVFDDSGFPTVQRVIAEAAKRGWRHYAAEGKVVALQRAAVRVSRSRNLTPKGDSAA